MRRLEDAEIDAGLDGNGEAEDGWTAMEATIAELAAKEIGTSCGSVGNKCFEPLEKAAYGSRLTRGWHGTYDRYPDMPLVDGMFHIECSSEEEAEKISDIAAEEGNGSLRPSGRSLWIGFWEFEIE